MSPLRRDEDGFVLVTLAVSLIAVVALSWFVIDVGNWWMHKRHLQNQADAGALAGAGVLRYPSCSDPTVSAVTATYVGAGSGGVTYNDPQDAGISPAKFSWALNSGLASPCTSGIVDVTARETDPPWYFHIPGLAQLPFAIKAHARVELRAQTTRSGGLPIGVPDANPKAAHVWLVNEATGAVLAQSDLTRSGSGGGLALWSNQLTPLPVTFAASATDLHVSAVVSLAGTTTMPPCGQPLVQCYDATAALGAGGVPSTGLSFIRGWTSAGSGTQPNAPLARSVSLVPGTCANPYFVASTTSCTFGVSAKVDFGPTTPAPTAGVGASLTATVGGTTYPLTYNTTSQTWASATTIPIAPAAGPVAVTMDWAETKGTFNGNSCKNGNGNKCMGSFGTVQRAFSATDDRSGPIKLVQVSEAGALTGSVERCSTAQTSCTHSLVVTVGVQGSLGLASSAGDPVVSLRVVGGSQNQSLDCDPAVSQLKSELAQGCSPLYKANTGTSCPGSPNTLWGQAQPWSCVAVQTGTARNQVSSGMNLRILGDEKAHSCTAPNHWSSFPALDPGDPRILEVFVTPFGAFGGSGSTTVPVTDFATFYVTGWTGQGNGFDNPCEGQGDDAVPNGDSGYIVGHFIKYISPNLDGGGTAACDPLGLGSCVAVMTQ
jgi:hypothetical protein